MFESDDWIFEDAFNDKNGVEEETRRKSHIPCHDQEEEEETSSVKRRRVDSALAQQSQVDTVANVIEDNEDLPLKNVSRGDLLLGIFQKNISREASDFAKEVENYPSGQTHGLRLKTFCHEEARGKSHESIVEERLAKEVKLVRIFPGPAGLVPDQEKNNTTISAVSYLSSIEDVEKSKPEIEYRASKPRSNIEIKSQDEKNLAGEKAWKLLLNELPKDFLQDYNISTVKDKANASRCDSTKVRFIAGVLDSVDPSHDDPFVVLKDSTGSIEGTIHRDIPLTYPGILEPNVVILLRDVGLIKTTTYVVTNKYHILVSLVNLLAIYSDKGRIVSIPSFMESILSHASNETNDRRPASLSGLQKMDESHNASRQASSSIDSASLRIETHQAELATTTSLLPPTNEKYVNCGEEALGRGKTCQETLGCFNYSMDTDDLNSMDIFFTTDCDFTSLKEQDGLDHSLRKSTSISRANKIQRCNLQVENMENMKKESTVNFQKQMKERHLPQTLQKCVTDVNTRGSRYSRENCFSPYDAAACRDSNVNAMSTLLEIKRNIENSKTLISYFTNDNKGDKYDSDDEILSQLDVDKVFDKSKKDC